MQLTRKTHPWKYPLAAVAVVLVVTAAVVPRHHPMPSYLRYISPPLPDGVRYTFLYPSMLDDVFTFSYPAHYPGKYLQEVGISKKESRLPGAALWQNWFKPEAEFVSVVVEKPTTKPLKSSRVEKQTWNGVETSHTVELNTPRAHEHFRFSHAEDYGKTTAFHQHDRVVTDSFRLLLPGEPVPRP